MSGDLDFETHPLGTKKILEGEITMLRGELESQAANAVNKMADLISRNQELSQALLPFALAHTSGAPLHEVTLVHLRTAHETLNE